MAQFIKCPNCGAAVEIEEALRLEVENRVRKETEEKLKEKIREETLLEIKDLEKALAEKDQKLAEFRESELKLREEKRKLEERAKELNLEIQRRLEEERKKVEEETYKKVLEEHRLLDMEKDKRIADLKKALEEAQMKANQGSQQTQGEVLELDVENTLRSAFPSDEIQPVEKGVKGADIRQIVKSPRGFVCGVILWETKRTKAWTDEWLGKLKDDLRSEKADIAVIISTSLPKEAEKGLGIKENVWVVSYDLFIPLAIALRKNLLDVSYQKAISLNRGRKADLLYEFITGNEFRQQVEALVEVYQEMKEQLDKERVAFERIWKTRDSQIKRLITSTINIYYGASGLVGSSMPQIKGLELLSLEAENKK